MQDAPSLLAPHDGSYTTASLGRPWTLLGDSATRFIDLKQSRCALLIDEYDEKCVILKFWEILKSYRVRLCVGVDGLCALIIPLYVAVHLDIIRRASKYELALRTWGPFVLRSIGGYFPSWYVTQIRKMRPCCSSALPPGISAICIINSWPVRI